MDVEDKSLNKYYAIARGKVAGIFTDFDEVKKHVSFMKCAQIYWYFAFRLKVIFEVVAFASVKITAYY